jgi:hypothetical protein
MGILGKLFGRKAEVEVAAKEQGLEARAAAMTIKPSSKRLESENWAHSRAFEQIESELRSSGLFKPESLPAMMAAIRANSPPFTPVNAALLVGKKARPGPEEARISLADCLAPGQAGGDTAASRFVQELCNRRWHEAQNQRSLMDMRASGIKSVEVTIVEATACAKVKRLTGRYPIDDAPQLPLPGCDGKGCHCFYRPVIPGLD